MFFQFRRIIFNPSPYWIIKYREVIFCDNKCVPVAVFHPTAKNFRPVLHVEIRKSEELSGIALHGAECHCQVIRDRRMRRRKTSGFNGSPFFSGKNQVRYKCTH